MLAVREVPPRIPVPVVKRTHTVVSRRSCISTPIDKTALYYTAVKMKSSLYWARGGLHSHGRRCTRMHLAGPVRCVSKRRIYFVGTRNCVSARHRGTDTTRDTCTHIHSLLHTRIHMHTRHMHTDARAPARNSARLKARKKSQTRLNVAARRTARPTNFFFVRDNDDR